MKNIKTFKQLNESGGVTVISTPEAFNKWIDGFRDEIGAQCTINKAQCLNDKIDVVNSIMRRENVEVESDADDDKSDWVNNGTMEEIIMGTWED